MLGMQTNSNHLMVVLSTSIQRRPKYEEPLKRSIKYDTNKLVTNENLCRNKYKNTYDKIRTQLNETVITQEKFNSIQKAMAKAATETIGTVTKTKNKFDSTALDSLSLQQKELRLKMKNARHPELRENERNEIWREIRKLANSITASRLD